MSTMFDLEFWLTKLRYFSCEVRTNPLYFAFCINIIIFLQNCDLVQPYYLNICTYFPETNSTGDFNNANNNNNYNNYNNKISKRFRFRSYTFSGEPLNGSVDHE
ncbi:hypothetical protein GQX74_014262 [Glossina fuscipes]|nr:hypothetical protein GQX74_014262 [Glossina fuscipes]